MKADSKHRLIRLGASSESIPLVESGVRSLEAKGYEVKVITFDDFFVPNTSLKEGSIDVNLYQHEVFMNNYNKANKTNIIMLHPKLYNYFAGFYSKKGSSLRELPEGGKIGIANDASNIDQHLRLLRKWGFILLTDKKREQYTAMDVVDNPKNFKFVQLDYKQRISALDELAGMVCGSNTVFMAGLDPTRNVLYKEVDNAYAIGLCMNGDTHSVDEQWVKDLIASYTSDEAFEYVLNYFKGAYARSEQFEQFIKGK